MPNIFDGAKCTFYKNVVEHKYKNGPLTTPGRVVSLLEVLSNERYTNQILLTKLRTSGYKSDYYNENKRQLSATSFSSVQDDLNIDRSDANHLFHTGFIAFDIDANDNPALLYDDSLKEWIIDNIPYVAYLGKSVSNLGYWGLFPIRFKDEHDGHYEAMKKYFKDRNIIIDNTQDVSRLRFLSYDPDAHFELNPEIYAETLAVAESISGIEEYERPNITDALFVAACRWVEAKHGLEFKHGMIHNYLLRLYAILRSCHIGREKCLNWIYNNLIEADKITTNCLDEVDFKRK